MKKYIPSEDRPITFRDAVTALKMADKYCQQVLEMNIRKPRWANCHKDCIYRYHMMDIWLKRIFKQYNAESFLTHSYAVYRMALLFWPTTISERFEKKEALRKSFR